MLGGKISGGKGGGGPTVEAYDGETRECRDVGIDSGVDAVKPCGVFWVKGGNSGGPFMGKMPLFLLPPSSGMRSLMGSLWA